MKIDPIGQKNGMIEYKRNQYGGRMANKWEKKEPICKKCAHCAPNLKKGCSSGNKSLSPASATKTRCSGYQNVKDIIEDELSPKLRKILRTSPTSWRNHQKGKG